MKHTGKWKSDLLNVYFAIVFDIFRGTFWATFVEFLEVLSRLVIPYRIYNFRKTLKIYFLAARTIFLTLQTFPITFKSGLEAGYSRMSTFLCFK